MSGRKIGVKVVILGDSSVGKSSIVGRLIFNKFDQQISSTVGAAFITKTIKIKNKEVKLELWDTAGQERFRGMIPIYYRGAKIAIIVYDITNKQSYDDILVRWVDELSDFISNDTLICLVGNKLDKEEDRQVEHNAVEQYCEEHRYIFYEVSAKSGENVDEVFSSVCKHIIDNGMDTKNKDETLTLEQDIKLVENKKCCFT